MTGLFLLRPQRVLLGVLLLATCLAAPVSAATLAPAARGEIDALLTRLGTSGCQFERNGTWYTADEARAHLLKKLDYLVGRGAVASAEQFIERAATQSSVSGQPYAVKCRDAAARPSGDWLRAELRALRAGTKNPR